MNRHVYDATLDANSDRKGFFASSNLVTATGFFRLRDLYSGLYDSILPQFNQVGLISMWSAGCSDGREPYSIALCTQRYIHSHPENRLSTFKLRASDITEKMIQTGNDNNYELNTSEVDRLKPYERYVTFNDEKRVTVNGEVRRKIDFVLEDIIKHKAQKKYDIMICTNVLFYYEMEYRKSIITDLLNNLKPGGYLYVESIGGRFMRSIDLDKFGTGNHFFKYGEESSRRR